MSIAIFPAAGGLGGATLNHLLNFIPPKDVVLVARKPEKLAQEKELGATIRRADYDDVSTVQGAFDGVKILNLISYQSAEHEHRVDLHKMAIDSAIASGVRHIVYSSLAYGGLYTCPPFACQPMLAHVDTEAYLRSVQEKDPFKISFTIVRVGLYAEGFDLYTAAFDINAPPADGLIKIPHDGSGPGISWAKKDELGEGVARVLQRLHKEIETEQYQNKLLVLSGPKDYSLADTAEVLSSVLGKDIKIKEVSVDEYANQSSVQSGSEYGAGDFALLWASTYEAIKRGLGSAVTPLLRQLLGRQPTSFEEVVQGMKN